MVSRGGIRPIPGRLVPLAAGLLVLAAATLLTAPARALTCSASVEPRQATVGQVVTLTVSVDGEFGWSADFTLPPITGADVADGGTSQSVSLINGITQASMSRTWYLTLTGSGDIRIGPVTVRAGKEECRTDPVTISVDSRGRGATPPPSVTGNRSSRAGGSPGTASPPAKSAGGRSR